MSSAPTGVLREAKRKGSSELFGKRKVPASILTGPVIAVNGPQMDRGSMREQNAPEGERPLGA